jgi:hypothetical protein
VLQIVVNGGVALEVEYQVKDDKLTLTIDGSESEYRRPPKKYLG